jgi:hypothetical protein
MAQAILVRVSQRLHRAAVQRAAEERLTLQAWTTRVLEQALGVVGPGARRMTVTEKYKALWRFPGDEPEPPGRARRGGRGAGGARAGGGGAQGVPLAEDGASGPERPGSPEFPEEAGP